MVWIQMQLLNVGMKNFVVYFMVFLLSGNVFYGASFHVKTNGTASGNGSITNPWNLQTALNHPSRVAPGDTIWIHEGTYKGIFTSNIWGRANAPIVVRAMPGKEVILDGNASGSADATLTVKGEYTYIWGLTITNTNGNRGANATDIKDGIYLGGANCKIINCIIHNNGGNGIGFWSTAINSEIYGCIIYNNGYRGDDRGHGHGIYGQNETGTKQIKNNILFNSFGLGMSIYTQGGNIKGFNIEGNMMFNSGLPGNSFLERHILIGGLKPADRITIKSNYLYNRPNYPSKAALQLGYGADNVDAEVANNYMVDGTFYVIYPWNSVKFTGNSVLARSSSMQLISFDNFQNIKTPSFNNNSYYVGTLAGMSFDAWKNVSKQDLNSTYRASLPSTSFYVVQNNQFEPGRAHVVIYNWAKQNIVQVNVSGVLKTGDDYKVYDVSNLKAGPVLTGKYQGGNIGISMQLTQVELPYGNLPNDGRFVHTAPDFGTFLIVSTNSGVPSGSDTVLEEQTKLEITNCYPNPVSDNVIVDIFSPKEEQLTIDVFNLIGKMAMSKLFNFKAGKNSHKIDLSFLPAGIYLISVSNSFGNSTFKVVKSS